ncbi:MAG TPA: amidohydrolase [Salinivirga sp.]|uniref:amidohydrolase n=1 Tax=Salinivirga sp. TaxID=1970192 RepID=UPI002B45931A|nr:amidohydrolase [Salinivirga sp.]HKK59558.1 amidohydrolase [Salinivirga sp.]
MELNKLVSIRKYLHQNPELSHKEKNTSGFLKKEIEKTNPSDLISQDNGHGFLVRYRKEKNKPVIAFRTDIDALPIQEINTFDYKSNNDGVGHKCGHDGHATSMLGFAHELKQILDAPVDLIFQGAEETGEGADLWLKDSAMKDFNPNRVFAHHNLPGFPLHSIIVRNNVFSAASVGVTVKLKGKTSHAGHPERGISPALAVADLIKAIENLPNSNTYNDFTLTTVIHTLIGEIAFGTTPGYGEVRATLRSFDNDDLDALCKYTEQYVNKFGEKYGLKTEVSYQEYFPATENDDDAVAIVRKAAENLGLEIIEPEEPFRWSEDFAHFTLKTPGALFGVGSGVDHPALHNPDYDYPDELLPTVIKMYKEIYRLSI